MSKKYKSEVVQNAVRRFAQLPDRTIARHILATYGELFDNDLEKIRSQVRYYTGKNGKQNLDILKKNHPDLLKKDTIKLPPTWRRIRTDYKLPLGLWLILSDTHIPFHEPKPLESAILAGQVEKVDGVFLNGDWQDCSSLSFWPTAHRDFNREIELVIDSLDFLRAEFPKEKIIYKPGNHELRLPNYYIAHAPELAESPLACMETILDFEGRNIEFLDYYQKVYAGKLPIIHGHEVRYISRAVNPARGLFLRTKTYSACSHCHTTSSHTTRDLHGKDLTTHSFGCLCDLSPEYNPFGNDWNWGFALVNIEKDGNFEVINRRILSSGKVV